MRISRRLAVAFLGLIVLAGSGCGSTTPVDPGDGNGDGRLPAGFMPGVEFATDSPGMDLTAVDVDGNGRLDLIIPLLGGGVKVVYNMSVPGLIEFDAGHPKEDTERSLLDAAVADYNDDDRADLFTLDNAGYLEIRLQDEQGVFNLLGRYPTEGTQLCVDRVNSSDDTLDVLLASDRWRDMLAVYQMPDGGGVDPDDGSPGGIPGWRDQPSSSQYREMKLTDFEGNGLMDAVLADELDHSLQVFTHIELPLGDLVNNPETGEPEEPQPGVFYGYQAACYEYSICDLPTPGPMDDPHNATPLRLASGDIDHDGLTDVAALCSYFGGMPEQPWYTTSPSQTLAVPLTMIWLLESTIIEYDPLYDWTTDDTAPRTATLTARTGLTFPNLIQDVKLVDVDRDGELDVLGCCDGSGGGGFSFFYFPGLGDFQFSAPLGFTVAAPPFRLVAEDFDGDEYVDVAVLLPTLNAITVFRNDADTGLGEGGTQYVFLEE